MKGHHPIIEKRGDQIFVRAWCSMTDREWFLFPVAISDPKEDRIQGRVIFIGSLAEVPVDEIRPAPTRQQAESDDVFALTSGHTGYLLFKVEPLHIDHRLLRPIRHYRPPSKHRRVPCWLFP